MKIESISKFLSKQKPFRKFFQKSLDVLVNNTFFKIKKLKKNEKLIIF